MALLRFKPIPKQTVWGGNTVRDYYGYDWMPDNVGMAWAFADQGEDSNICTSGEYEGETLGTIWKQHEELFGDTNRPFPLIVSLLGPVADLSIQIHPDTAHAQLEGYPYGKNECWYFLDAAPGSKIVFGHNAVDENDLRNYVEEKRWNELISHLDVKKDDFIYIPAGLLHACCKNTLVYEVQQSTNVTYRFYDFDRIDANGKKRELHLEKAISCVNYDKAAMTNTAHPVAEELPGMRRTHLISNESFTVEKLEVSGPSTLSAGPYQLITVARGSGFANGEKVTVGDHFLLPQDEVLSLDGDMMLFATTA